LEDAIGKVGLSIWGVLVGALGWAGVVPWLGVVKSSMGCVAGRAKDDAETESFVVLGGEVGEFSAVSDEALEAGEVGGRFLDSGSRCTLVCGTGWVMMGGGAKVGTGGAEEMMGSLEVNDASPKVEGVTG